MAGRKTVVQLEYNSNVESLLKYIDKLLNQVRAPDLIYVNLSSTMFPRRVLDIPNKFKELLGSNPRVKMVWDGYNDILVDSPNLVFAKEGEFALGNKVVVAMTSWKKRIQNCYYVINCLLRNSTPPDLVFLTLSTQEFPNLCADLPEDLRKLCMSNHKVKLNWVGPNTKSMKKVFPILGFIDDDTMIVTIDDDLEVPSDLIELRVKEFVQHGGRFAISGGTNPQWHLNKRLYSSTYNVLTSTSIFSKKMLAGYDRILCDRVIETYNDDLTYTLILLSNGYQVLPSTLISTKSGKTRRKVMFQNECEPMRLTNGYMSNEETIRRFEERFEEVNGCSLKDSLFNLVVFDSMNCAGDNGEYFYRKAKQLNPSIKMTFLLSQTSPDWKRLYDDGFNLYPFEGEDLQVVLKNASFILWSKDLTNMTNLTSPFRNKSVFLQHGIASEIYDFSHYMESIVNDVAKYACCSSEEEARIIKQYSSGKVIPLAFGMPRHDFLLEKDILAQKTKKPKCVFISFHWRRGRYDKNEQAFKGSRYLYDINKLLNDSALKNLVDEGVKIMFLPHARFIKYLDLFDIPSWIDVPKNIPFQELLVQSDVLVTDFSSNSFELAYMDKPSVIFVPGQEYVRTYMPHYHIDKLRKYPHMVYSGTVDETCLNIKKAIQDGRQKGLAQKLFGNVDQNNTKRLLEFLIAQYQ